MIYFDFAATTPLDIDAADAYVKTAVEFYGNPNSLHDIGGQASELLDHCRGELANILGIEKRGLYFTSGGSEGNFLAIDALLSAVSEGENHIITSMAEHSSIHGVLNRLKKSGYTVTYLPFSTSGLVDLDQLAFAVKPETALITIQHVNSEIGSVQPIAKIAELCRAQNIYFHSDFVQSLGKLDLRKVAPLVSSFSFSGHKIYGPKGAGGVYINPQIGLNSFFPGTTHENGLRPGTVNVPGIVSMTAAAQKLMIDIQTEYEKFYSFRQAFFERLTPIHERVHVFEAQDASQLPSIIGMAICGIEGQLLMLECNRHGFAISTGSACQAGMQTPSKAMLALGVNDTQTKEFIRISFGKTTTLAEVEKLGDTIVKIVNSLS